MRGNYIFVIHSTKSSSSHKNTAYDISARFKLFFKANKWNQHPDVSVEIESQSSDKPRSNSASRPMKC